MKNVYMMIGNIGSGKSTTAKKLSKNPYTITLSDDNLCNMLNLGEYGPKYWAPKYRELYRECIWEMYCNAIKHNFNVILDMTNMSIEKRASYLELITRWGDHKAIAYLHTRHGLEDRIRESRGQTKEMWERVWNRFNDEYEEPTLNEGFSKIIKVN